ncbi:MAG: hypothetical protein C0179_02800 [Fervidicoccus sp.]|nr:MAG: hypothetical protein C0179_02800 [Fervidicoccus sp.]
MKELSQREFMDFLSDYHRAVPNTSELIDFYKKHGVFYEDDRKRIYLIFASSLPEYTTLYSKGIVGSYFYLAITYNKPGSDKLREYSFMLFLRAPEEERSNLEHRYAVLRSFGEYIESVVASGRRDIIDLLVEMMNKYKWRIAFALGAIYHYLKDVSPDILFDVNELERLFKSGLFSDRNVLFLNTKGYSVLWIRSGDRIVMFEISSRGDGSEIDVRFVPNVSDKYVEALLDESSYLRSGECIDAGDDKVCISSAGFEEDGVKNYILLVHSPKFFITYLISGDDESYSIKPLFIKSTGKLDTYRCDRCRKEKALEIIDHIITEVHSYYSGIDRNDIAREIYFRLLNSIDLLPEKFAEDVLREALETQISE